MSLAISVLLCLADLWLLGFHVFLIHKDLSTYKYIRGQKAMPKSKVIKQVKRGGNASSLSDPSSMAQPSAMQDQQDQQRKVAWSDIIVCGACAPRPISMTAHKTNSLVPEK